MSPVKPSSKTTKMMQMNQVCKVDVSGFSCTVFVVVVVETLSLFSFSSVCLSFFFFPIFLS